MKKKSLLELRIEALKPRNLWAVLARRRNAGAHGTGKRGQNAQQKDLVQRLREAGL